MIDIHSHIIFGVDDGPKSLDESLALLKVAYDQGTRIIVATSHRRKGMFETPEEIIQANFKTVKAEAKKLFPDLQLLFGAEIYYTRDILDKLTQKKIPTMNGTQFALIEFSMATPWKEIHSALQNILLLGITPIVAHIERYNALEFDKKRVKEIINMGCYTQINSVHVTKAKFFGDSLKVFKKRAHYFLDENLVHIVSSDMHNTDKRPPFMAQAYELIESAYGQSRAERLFRENALTLLKNQLL
ncbi:capsular polysaccharide biosynthesis protein Cps4B [Streptococcus caprae]|uniref:Tyrosine-protein phosphatase n=1 Tax=Streptococcus caprae TaxID=1640501 RepID=A0ABV8CTZ7_9STRE